MSGWTVLILCQEWPGLRGNPAVDDLRDEPAALCTLKYCPTAAAAGSGGDGDR